MHEDEARVHDDAGQRDDAEDRHHREVEGLVCEELAPDVHHPVADDRTDEAERNHGHDDQWLNVGAERDREQCVDRAERDHVVGQESGKTLDLFRLLSLERVRHAGVVRDQEREELALEGCDDVVGSDLVHVDVGVHVDHAVAIRAFDRGEASPELRLGDGVEGHLASVRRADTEVVEIREGAAVLVGVADHHADVVAPALDALRLLAVEGLTDLLGEIVEGEAEGLRGRQDVELQLALARPKRIADVRDTGLFGKLGLQAGGGFDQVIDVVASELDVDGVAGVEECGVERELDNIGYCRRVGAPAPLDLGRADRTVVARLDRDADLREVTAARARWVTRAAIACVRLLPDGEEHVLHE